MRVALLNLRYSPNLGDVLLCECLEFGLRQAVAGTDILQLDITGRRDFAKASSRRLAVLALLQWLPRVVRQLIARAILGRSLRRTWPYWQTALAKVDAAVLGGGNLLADADLNFPLKVGAMFRAIAAAGLPAGVYAVGVSDNWSQAGETLFRKALMSVQLVHAAVRDEHSKEIWIRRLGPVGVATPKIVRDPGLLASDCYPARQRAETSKTRVGICVTHPVALRYHADEKMPSAAALTAWNVELVQAFVRRGFAVTVFTTGSPEDRSYLDGLLPLFLSASGAGESVELVHLGKASDLAGLVSTLDLVLGHRLHACVSAYSFGIPNIGFTWDRKMQSFFQSVGRGKYVCSAGLTPIVDVIDLAEEAIQAGIDVKERRAIIEQTYMQMRSLLNDLATRPKRGRNADQSTTLRPPRQFDASDQRLDSTE